MLAYRLPCLRDEQTIPTTGAWQMPKYHFDVSDGRCSPDINGVDLTDDMSARREATRRMILLLRMTRNGNGASHLWKVAVKDERREILFCIEARSEADLRLPEPRTPIGTSDLSGRVGET